MNTFHTFFILSTEIEIVVLSQFNGRIIYYSINSLYTKPCNLKNNNNNNNC